MKFRTISKAIKAFISNQVDSIRSWNCKKNKNFRGEKRKKKN